MTLLNRNFLSVIFAMTLFSSNLLAGDFQYRAETIAALAAAAFIADFQAEQEQAHQDQPEQEPMVNPVHSRINGQTDLMRRLLSEQRRHLRQNKNNAKNRHGESRYRNNYGR